MIMQWQKFKTVLHSPQDFSTLQPVNACWC